MLTGFGIRPDRAWIAPLDSPVQVFLLKKQRISAKISIEIRCSVLFFLLNSMHTASKHQQETFMEYERRPYPDKLIKRKDNGRVKVITGLRRAGVPQNSG
ncbi:MAG: hypothetical protein SPK11_05195 [Bullifex sp.]|nr:hypothetical protein [Bullifex sp.]